MLLEQKIKNLIWIIIIHSEIIFNIEEYIVNNKINLLSNLTGNFK